MERDVFKTLAAGKYAMSNLEGTIDKDKMIAFVEGATYAFDFMKKQNPKGGENGKNSECESIKKESISQESCEKTNSENKEEKRGE